MPHRKDCHPLIHALATDVFIASGTCGARHAQEAAALQGASYVAVVDRGRVRRVWTVAEMRELPPDGPLASLTGDHCLESVPVWTPIAQAANALLASGQLLLPVTHPCGALEGFCSARSLLRAMAAELPEAKPRAPDAVACPRAADDASAVDDESRLLRELAQHIGEVFWISSPDRTTLYYVSPAYERIWGRPAAQAYADADSFFHTIHPQDRGRVLRQIDALVFSGDSREFIDEFRIVRPDGEQRWLETRLFAVRGPDGRVVRIAAVSTDITDRKRVEVALAESETRLRTIVETIPVVWFVYRSWPDGRQSIEYVSSGISSLLGLMPGLPPDALLELLWQRVHADDVPRLREAIEASSRTLQSLDVEFRIRQSEERTIWVRGCAKPSADDGATVFRGVLMDITVLAETQQALRVARDALEQKVVERTRDLRQANQELRASLERLAESETRFRALVEALSEGVLLCDRQGYVTACNPAAEKILGLARENILNQPAASLCLPHVNEAGLPLAAEEHPLSAALRGEPCQDFVIGIQVPAGQTRWLLLSTHCLPPSNIPSREAAVVSFSDITIRRQMETSARQQRDQLAHVLRAATMGEMGASIAHELSQPLTAMATYAAALQAAVDGKIGNPADLRTLAEKIEHQAVRAGEIVRRLRKLVQRTPAVQVPVNLNMLLRDTICLLKYDVRLRNVELKLDLDPLLGTVRGDSVQLQQVLMNLIRNALEAMGASAAGARRLELRTWRREGQAHVSVSDSGPGIAPQVAERLFEPFVTTKPDGLGMGLAICRSIIEAHGGAIWHESRPEGGATFVISLPAHDHT